MALLFNYPTIYSIDAGFYFPLRGIHIGGVAGFSSSSSVLGFFLL